MPSRSRHLKKLILVCVGKKNRQKQWIFTFEFAQFTRWPSRQRYLLL